VDFIITLVADGTQIYKGVLQQAEEIDMAKMGKYEQVMQTMRRIATARATRRCAVCGKPTAATGSATCGSYDCLRKWLPGNREAHEEGEHDHEDQTADVIASGGEGGGDLDEGGRGLDCATWGYSRRWPKGKRITILYE